MRKRFGNTYLRILLVILLIIGLHYAGAFTPLERLWVSLINVTGGTTSSLTNNIRFWEGWKDKAQLEEEIKTLRSKLQRNESSLAHLNALQKENDELKAAIDWKNTERQNSVIGKLIGKPLQYPATFEVLNRGASDGVVVGQPVIINEDILVGKVVEVTTDSAIIQLITDNNSKFSVRKSDQEDAIGLISGRLGLALELSFVPATETLDPGTILVTSGLDTMIPSGLVIGSIDEIEVEDNDFFQKGSLTLSYDPAELSIVSVILTQ